MMESKTKVRGSKTGRPIMRLLDMLGKRWSLRILWELRDQKLTFRELREQCDGVSPTSLNQRLKELRELNLVEHNSEGYAHTHRGKELGAYLMTLSEWSTDWEKDL